MGKEGREEAGMITNAGKPCTVLESSSVKRQQLKMTIKA